MWSIRRGLPRRLLSGLRRRSSYFQYLYRSYLFTSGLVPLDRDQDDLNKVAVGDAQRLTLSFRDANPAAALDGCLEDGSGAGEVLDCLEEVLGDAELVCEEALG